MSELERITAFITENLPERAMQMFSAVMEDCELVYYPKALGLGQRRIGVLRYNAVLSWDNFPYRACSPGLVYALVLVWLEEHANALRDDLKLGGPTVDPEFDDEGSSIIQIVIPVADEIVLKPSDTGIIPAKGKRWDVVYPEILTASEAEFITLHSDKS